MAKSHPALSYDHAVSRPTFCARHLVSSIAVLVSIAATAIIFNSPVGSRPAGLCATLLAAPAFPLPPPFRFPGLGFRGSISRTWRPGRRLPTRRS